MATEFKPSVLVSDVFGSAGDVTAVHRDGKTYLRKRRSGTMEMTPSQAAHAQVHSRALAAWRTLPQSVQELWHKLARDVEPHRPPFDHTSWISGQNLFVSAYHGFYTLGNEHVPEPVPFELFPPFALKAVEAIVQGEGLVLRLSLSGLERLGNLERYWLYGQFQLVVNDRSYSTTSWNDMQICITGAWNSPHKTPAKGRECFDYGKKVTSAKVATQASKALQDGRSSARTKSIAGSALSQREKPSSRKK